MKQKRLFRRAATLLLSSTLVVSVPLTANAVTITDNGHYEILFRNYGGTIGGVPDSKLVSFDFDSDNEVVDLTDLVSSDVKYRYYPFEGWEINDELVTTITKDDFEGGYYLDANASFDYSQHVDNGNYFIELDFGNGGYSEENGQNNGRNVIYEIPKSQFSDLTLPIPSTYDGVEFLGWLEGGYYAHNTYNVRPQYEVVTADDFVYDNVLSFHATYKKPATKNDTTRVLTLDANGGLVDGVPSERIVECDNPQDISLIVPENQDETLIFRGWNTKADGSGYMITHTGFKGDDPEDDGGPGWCDIFEHFGDEEENITLYAVWMRDPVRPETSSENDKGIAEKAVQELLRYKSGSYSDFDLESETADMILEAADAGKNVTLGFVMKKDLSESALKNKNDLRNNWNVITGDVLDDPYQIYISIKADGKEIGRIKHMGILINEISIPVPDGMFETGARDKQTARIYKLTRNSRGGLDTYFWGEEIKDGYVTHRLNEYEETDCDNFLLVGRSEMNVQPYDNRSSQDSTAASNIAYYGTIYRADPESADDYSDTFRATIDAAVKAYKNGKNIYGRFVFEEVQPTDAYKKLVKEKSSEYKDFTVMRYYRIVQAVYADDVLIGTLPTTYSSISYSFNDSQIAGLPAMEPRYTRQFMLFGLNYKDEDNWSTSIAEPDVKDDGTVKAYYYGSEADIFAFGYYKSGSYTAQFGSKDLLLSVNGKASWSNPYYRFNFLSDDEQLTFDGFFGIRTVEDPLRPYRTFLGWQKQTYDNTAGKYVYTDVSYLSKADYVDGSNLYLVASFDETIPHNTGKYYITLTTRSGKIDDLPDLGGKVTWSSYPGGYDGWNYYVGVVKSSDLTTLTIPAPKSEEMKFLGWNCEFDPESGTVKSHSATLTSADFAQSDAIELTADYTRPVKPGDELSGVAILDCNGGTIDGQEIAYYFGASDSWMMSYSMNLIVPERPGYKFTGWNTKKDGTGEMIDETGNYFRTIFSPYHEPVICDENNNVKLYAQWEFTGTPVSSVTLNKTSATLEIGSTLTLTATVLPENAENKTLTWTSSDTAVATVKNGKVTAVANGTAVITAKAVGGAKAQCTVKVNTLLNKSTVSANEAEFGKSIAINGKAEAGTSPYTYAYYYRKVGNSVWKTIGTAFTDTTKATFKAPVAAEYEIKVTVKDNKGKTADKIMKVNFYQTPELENTSAVASSTVDLGEAIRINASAEGGKPQYTFAYYYKRSVNTKWNQIADFTSSATASFKPKAAADFDIKVIVKDSAGTTAEKIMTVTVSEPSLRNEAYLNTEKAQIGDDIRITGAAMNGTGPYKYAFYFKRSTNTKWNKMGTEFGTATYATLVPKAAAEYDLKCIVKDSTGATSERVFKATVVESMELTNISLINTDTEVPVGKTVTISGRTVGGTKPCTFEFYFKRSVNSKWNKLSYGSEKGTYAKFTPTVATSFDLKVIATDSKGTKANKIITINAS